MFDLHYADDIVLLAVSKREAQLLLDRVVLAAAHVGLVINAAKTKFMGCSAPLIPVIHLEGSTLKVVDSFTYLERGLTPNGDTYGKVRTRTDKASGVFLPLVQPPWGDVRLQVKWRVFDACVLSVLIYGC